MARDSESESVMSSTVLISGAESFSDDGSTLSAGDSKPVMPGATDPGSGFFDLGDGDLRLVINGTTLETHKFLIKKFAGLKNRIRDGIITLEAGEPEEKVFENVFKILYASVVDGPFDFDSSTLRSALLLSTRYDFPALRAFAIDKLVKAGLSAVERIRLAREFDIPSWEEPAYLELCERDEALSMSEAAVLGLQAVVHVARIREKEQRRRGKEVDAVEGAGNGVEKDQPGQPEAPSASTAPASFNAAPSTVQYSDSDKAGMPKMEPAEKNVQAATNPCFINAPALLPSELHASYLSAEERDDRIALVVPDCECAVEVPSDFPWLASPAILCQCKLPPCAVSAFKNLQTQQLAHETNISALENTVERIQATVTSLKSATEHNMDAFPPASMGSSSLLGDVQRWLVEELQKKQAEMNVKIDKAQAAHREKVLKEREEARLAEEACRREEEAAEEARLEAEAQHAEEEAAAAALAAKREAQAEARRKDQEAALAKLRIEEEAERRRAERRAQAAAGPGSGSHIVAATFGRAGRWVPPARRTAETPTPASTGSG